MSDKKYNGLKVKDGLEVKSLDGIQAFKPKPPTTENSSSQNKQLLQGNNNSKLSNNKK
jgi:hypothetical protein